MAGQERMQVALAEVISAMGVFGSREEKEGAVVQTFRQSHRTLQQGFMRAIILPILRHLATCAEEGRYDLRNEQSCKLAQKMLAAVTEDEQYLPFV